MNASFGRAYAAAFDARENTLAEASLQEAYELGRRAVRDGLSVLDLATAHHDALHHALAEVETADEAKRVVDAAADFFLESLSAFEMVQRGYREARESAAAEKRQMLMLRQLASFLTDASLAADTADAVQEVLQLVAESARELVGAGWCVACLDADDRDAPVVAVASADGAASAAPAALVKLASAVQVGSRATATELASDPAAPALACMLGSAGALRGQLTAPMRALDGRELGAIRLYDCTAGEFSEVDEAVLLHLAQIAATAIERAELVARGRTL